MKSRLLIFDHLVGYLCASEGLQYDTIIAYTAVGAKFHRVRGVGQKR